MPERTRTYTEQLTVRLSHEQLRRLALTALEAGLSPAAYIRAVLAVNLGMIDSRELQGLTIKKGESK